MEAFQKTVAKTIPLALIEMSVSATFSAGNRGGGHTDRPGTTCSCHPCRRGVQQIAVLPLPGAAALTQHARCVYSHLNNVSVLKDDDDDVEYRRPPAALSDG
ncbi:hypothetical protein ElyMa_005232500 [Elysia marginata]|uniref:Uncharacterized protein n=1 Tax=Elysia marginata TaxID=1093978 RepID=A0AAV4JVZ4_9GAST|nr:hypothetical protein ElyMa_005232500 [Elysia marginata]